MSTFVRDWLVRNDRAASPVFICGGSYGGFRLATMLAMSVNANWNWSGGPGNPRAYMNAAPAIEKAMHENSNLRIFAAGAYFDLATPLAATVFAFDHENLPHGRVTLGLYESGHSMYQHRSTHAELSLDVRAFVGR